MPCVITSCLCKSEYQDAKYGQQNRVHNLDAKDQGICTVCGTRRAVGKKESVASKKK